MTPRPPPHNHPRDSWCLLISCPRAGWNAGRAKRPVDRHSLAQALPEHQHCTDNIRGHESCLAVADTILRNLEGEK